MKKTDYLKAIACALKSTQFMNDMIYDNVLGGLSEEACGYQERGTDSSSESERDQTDAFDINFGFKNNPFIEHRVIAAP